MAEYNFKVLKDFDDKLILEIKKLEIENLGKDAALNEWQIPVIIRYGKFIVALNEGKKIIGVCQALKTWEDINTAFIHSFYVIKDYRNKRVGTSLLNFVINYFKKNKINTIKLTVDPENTAALNLYKKAGFKVAAFLLNEYGKDKNRFLMFLEI